MALSTTDMPGIRPQRQRWRQRLEGLTTPENAVLDHARDHAKAATLRHFPDFGFRALFKVAVDGMVLVDAAGIILALNPVARRIFDYGSNELLGAHVSALVATPFRAEERAWLDGCLREGVDDGPGVSMRALSGQRRDGSVVPVMLWLRRLPRGCGGNFVCTVRETGTVSA